MKARRLGRPSAGRGKPRNRRHGKQRPQPKPRNHAGDYVLRLYITGMTPRSTAAIQNIKAICDEHLRGRYRLEIIDIYQQPVLARGAQIIAAPTLIKRLPLPLRRFVGDMSQKEKILIGLDLRPKNGRAQER